MRLSVVVLVAVALLQPGSSQHGTQETEENHSTNGGRDQLTVLNLDHYLLLLNNKLDALSSKVEQLHAIVSQHKRQTAAELAQLQSSLESKLETVIATTSQLFNDHEEVQNNMSNMECMDSEEHLQLHQSLHDNLTHQLAAIQSDVSRIRGPYTCGGTGGWRRAVYLDMTDPSTTCPSGWNMTGYSKRTCGRATDGRYTCDSVTFSVSGGEYSRVCGRIKAYHWGATGAFHSYHHGYVTTIDGAYVDGISLTHSSPRQHIWTFAAGLSENFALSEIITHSAVCPCDTRYTINIPLFVGEDYFCESGVNEPWTSSRHFTFHSNDTLWDGEDCLSSSTCCSLHNPPYFIKQLPTPTTNDIEARICLGYLKRYRNIAVELFELYVQ